ncbi:hypothetical protein [Cohnella mopanensis]|uniref:hypothetical protein n=1 Tax=Cohnella mopanensis TaxID=2911966 RepID=UPI001EF817F4|nr:hypothetical protein [Cohnella mopanensis]
MRMFKLALVTLVLVIIVVGCREREHEQQVREVQRDCFSAAEVDYIDFLKFNDINYSSDSINVESIIISELIGKPLGEVSFMMYGQACLGHQTVNGDAAFLREGTKIYAMKGYKPEFRVIAGDRIFQSNDNPNAKTVSDVLDIAGKVEKVTEESTEDGSRIRELDPLQAKAFIVQILSLAYVKQEELAKLPSGGTMFFRIHLTDGTSFRIAFSKESKALSIGAIGNEEIQSLLVD